MSTPTVVHSSEELRRVLRGARARGMVGFVPTMGALHDGHMALVEEAHRRATTALVSIFVNPTQFGPQEDFARYPRDLPSDIARCAAAGVDFVFAPEPREMYPPGDVTRVRVGAMAETLCGPFRPGHFEGVATVVAKLFALVGSCVAVFGRKDYQQLKIIERMATDLRFDVDIVGVSTVREADGLAMSSRNVYLSPDERGRARALSRALGAAATAYALGERSARVLRALALDEVTHARAAVDYVSLNDPQSLAPLADETEVRGGALLALAARVGATRLIDNVVLGEDPAPRAAGGAMNSASARDAAREGMFIVVEGVDGAGSTTLVAELAAHLRAEGTAVHRTCEPSAGPIGAMIRQVLAHRLVVPDAAGATAPDWSTMALLFASDRLDHLQAEVLPHLRRGVTVISDRYDLSSLAYQSATARADARDALAWIRELNRYARRPDLTLVLDVRADVASERRRHRGAAEELYEGRELQARLCEAYAGAEALLPLDRMVHIDANVALTAVRAAAIEALERYAP